MTVFGATDFNSDKEQAMAKVAPKMYGILKSLSIFNRQIKKVSELMNKVNEIVSEVEGTETQSCPITQGKWYIRGEDGDDWINPNYGIYSDKDGCTYIVGYITRRGTEEGLANAKLIAAAPEMYELLRKIIITTDKLGTGAPFGFRDLFSEAREILACIDRKQEAQS